MPRQQLLGAVLVGKSILLREGLARILRAANFRILASVSCADDFARVNQPSPPAFLIVHCDDFDAALEQIELSVVGIRRICDRRRSLSTEQAHVSISRRCQRIFRQCHHVRQIHQVRGTGDDG